MLKSPFHAALPCGNAFRLHEFKPTLIFKILNELSFAIYSQRDNFFVFAH